MHPAALIGVGFALGTLGVKALTSETAKKACVKGLVAGMKVRDDITSVVDEAKAEFDDVVAEAEYERAGAKAEEAVAGVAEDVAEAVAEAEAEAEKAVED